MSLVCRMILVVDAWRQHAEHASSLSITALVVRTTSNIHELIIDFRARRFFHCRCDLIGARRHDSVSWPRLTISINTTRRGAIR